MASPVLLPPPSPPLPSPPPPPLPPPPDWDDSEAAALLVFESIVFSIGLLVALIVLLGSLGCSAWLRAADESLLCGPCGHVLKACGQSILSVLNGDFIAPARQQWKATREQWKADADQERLIDAIAAKTHVLSKRLALRQWIERAADRRAWTKRLRSVGVGERDGITLPLSSNGEIDREALSMHHGLRPEHASPEPDELQPDDESDVDSSHAHSRLRGRSAPAADGVVSDGTTSLARTRARLCLRLQRGLSLSVQQAGTGAEMLLESIELWREKAAEIKARNLRLRETLSGLRECTPELKAMRFGFEGFRSRSPRWTMASDAVSISEDGFWAHSCEHRRREGVFATPVIKHGVYQFGVRVAGYHHGMVIGVADAEQGGDQHDAMAWGLHLSHGALYTKPRGESNGGVLSTRQLISIDAAAEAEGGLVIDIEVDMTRRKLSFGAHGAPLREAPCTLSACVRPWAYLWNANDSVLIDKRPQGFRRHAKPNQELRPPSPKVLIPLRSRSLSPAVTSVFISDIDDSISAVRPPQPTLNASQYLPAYIATHPSKATQQVEADPEQGLLALEDYAPPVSTPERKRGMSSRGRFSSARSPGRSPGTSPERSHALSGRNSPYYALSARTSPISPRTTRGRTVTHMWDMVRYVTGTYSDTYQQL